MCMDVSTTCACYSLFLHINLRGAHKMLYLYLKEGGLLARGEVYSCVQCVLNILVRIVVKEPE